MSLKKIIVLIAQVHWMHGVKLDLKEQWTSTKYNLLNLTNSGKLSYPFMGTELTLGKVLSKTVECCNIFITIKYTSEEK